MKFPRRSGILLHPTALPGRFGIGDLGAGDREFGFSGIKRCLGIVERSLGGIAPLSQGLDTLELQT